MEEELESLDWLEPEQFPGHGSLAALQTGINRQQENNKGILMQIFISLNPRGANDRPASRRSAAKRTNQGG